LQKNLLVKSNKKEKNNAIRHMIGGFSLRKKTLDALDIELLRLLMEDSSQGYLQLSEKLNIHKDTIRKRVRNLVDRKVIDRFTIAINQDKLAELYPSIWRVVFAVAVLRDCDSLIKELLDHQNVIEVDEATPAAVHDILVQTQFKNMEEFNEFTKWLKSKQNIDSSRLDVVPIYKQHKRRRRILSAIKPNKVT
jgi:Lrp/AsnC family leucine-responsive transcriptional regulator